jgi:type II secretory pathway pseudopilin PulG
MNGKRLGGESGHLMVALVAAVAVMMILTFVAVQAWQDVLRRDLEAEMIFRAQDIVRALKRYRVDHGGKLPIELKEMMEPGPRGAYCLRKLWKDPLVKDGKWGLLYASPQGGYLDPNAPPGMDPSIPLGLPSGAAPGQQPLQPKQPQQPRAPDDTKTRPDREGSDESSPGGETDRSGSLRTRFGAGKQEMTGLPIIGVKSLCSKKPFRVINDQAEYALWRFTVLDLDQPMRPGAGPGGVNPQNPRQGLPGTPGPGGTPFGGKNRQGRLNNN